MKKTWNRDGKNSNPGSGINIPDLQHWLQVWYTLKTREERKMKRFCRKNATPGYTWVGLNVFLASSLNITYSPNRIQHEPIRALRNHTKRIKQGCGSGLI
jgi:hypothetical protein